MLLRIAGSTSLFTVFTHVPPAMGIFSCLVAGLLLVGFWTPLAASCQLIIEGVLACNATSFESEHLIHAVIGLSLVMLGPGSWSIDARLYGRKRIDLGDSRRERTPKDS